MKTKVLLIAPYRGLRELSLTLLKEQPELDVIVKEADLSASIPLIQYYEQQHIDFIISRGGTAKLIQQYSQIPVIEIKVSGYDIIRALTLIKDYKMKVQLIGFPNICEGVLSIAQLLDIQIAYTTIDQEEEVNNAVLEAKNAGAQVILGDTVTVRTAQENGLQGMMITSGKESVLEAFHQVLDMAKVLEQKRNQLSIFQSLLSNYQDGIAIMDENGEFIYCNQAFSSFFGKVQGDLMQSRFDLPLEVNQFLQRLIQLEEQTYVPNEIINFKHLTTTINGGRFKRAGKYFFYVTIHKKPLDKEMESGIQILRNHLFPTSFAQIVTSSPHMMDVLEKAKKLAELEKNIIIYGEEGTGKRFIAHSIHTASDLMEGDFIEIEINDSTTANISRIVHLIDHLDRATIYLKGVEYLSLENQHVIDEMANNTSRVRFIFAFNQHPNMLIKNNILHKNFIRKMEVEALFIPPLRERMEDLEELIRIFIAKYNAKYGKQIVGVRQEVLKELYLKDWSYKNVTELKDTIKEFVKMTYSDFIEKEQVKLMGLRENEKKSFVNTIDLTKPLDEIEKEIIAQVLEEENMNQSQAAKRLGINRTTLWRKLKG
ncbi:PrpR N-terminal domain-containing protein [Salipaludibacillus sp. CF4.18]|uniref:sigma-54-dependent Fis family transcriptional regulator n=1 Tax=Salipaludibacillus sp. CF4.18 TaxID=3373081 RepID=UPI003EE56F5C